ncbi:MAG TPA: class I SAM-dependent methyltransferase [Alphaproteobacteria bacterium]|nr:class I SAM-dependent methyltransferase [Alphaproteobacteria bacterium]
MSGPQVTDPPAIDGRSFAAAQAFLLSAKLYWTREIFPALKRDYQIRAADAGKQPESAAEVAALIGDTTLYRSYAWLERHLQRFKYSGRYGLQPYHAQQRAALEPGIDPAALPPGMLELDDPTELPAYYTGVDIHQHPGGVWSDEIAGFVYERGARTTTPTHGGRHQDLHDRLADAIEAGGAPERLLDMGCGFGKSTEPLYERFRDSDVFGVDLSAPCLKLAARRAADHQARNVRYAQRDAAATGLEAGTFDVVTSTMLLHEMPPKVVEATFAEAHRLLKPGGRMVHLDFHHLPDAFARFIHYGHGRRNNEPFMEPFAKMELKSVLADAGFENVAVTPYEEADGALEPGHADWRFPWTLIMAERPA